MSRRLSGELKHGKEPATNTMGGRHQHRRMSMGSCPEARHIPECSRSWTTPLVMARLAKWWTAREGRGRRSQQGWVTHDLGREFGFHWKYNFIISFLEKYVYWFLERERNIDWPVASHRHPTRDWTHSLSMCVNWTPNLLVYRKMLQPTEPHQPGLIISCIPFPL